MRTTFDKFAKRLKKAVDKQNDVTEYWPKRGQRFYIDGAECEGVIAQKDDDGVLVYECVGPENSELEGATIEGVCNFELYKKII